MAKTEVTQMTTEFLIGAVLASNDLHPKVKEELQKILYNNAFVPISEVQAIEALRDAGWVECDYNCMPFAMVKAELKGVERI